MDLQLSEQQELLKGSLDRYLERTLPFDTRRTQRGAGDFLAYWHDLVTELGIGGAGIAESCGGFGGGAEAEMLVAGSLGAALAVTPYLECNVFAAQVLSALDREPDVGRIAAGESLIVVAFEEAQTRGNVGAIECWADPVAEGWRFTGTKLATPFAAQADLVLVPARISDGDFAIFAILGKDLNTARKAYHLIDDTPVADLLLDGFIAPPETLIEQGAKVRAALESGLARALAAQCAEATALARTMLNDTLAYCRERTQFGVPLASFQALQHRMVDMYLTCEAMDAASLMAALRVDGVDAVAAAKATCADGLRLIGQEAVQLHGAMGLTEELRVGHFFKRATVLEYRFGSADVQVERYRQLRACVA